MIVELLRLQVTMPTFDANADPSEAFGRIERALGGDDSGYSFYPIFCAKACRPRTSRTSAI
ncbi:hypothetical protein [Mesorhizobium shangrilense]|uniref:Uncharacterized protein n=1 Tax=Mesorhizobium shangrilense TaxID=460060 RepID=A0ABV2DQJ8_9HYPH